MLLALTISSLLCALLPAVLFFLNLRIFRTPPLERMGRPVSVLIPARNEAGAIGAALESVLANEGVEVVVLDDGSEDATAEIVREFAQHDPRVRLEFAPPLPPGWNGKQHACHCLSQLASHPSLLFLDADVRLAPDAVARLAPLLKEADLLSGVPRQISLSFSEKLLIPLIHFVLLGFLPLKRMRASREPGLGAGCGQLFLTTADAYKKSGGHAAIRTSLHDGLHLPRLYRQAGLRTDLTDLTPLAQCRMYHGNAATWRGLAKNAHQGMGAWPVIFPMTLLLFFGQVAPFALFAWNHSGLALAAVLLAWGVRVMEEIRFPQSRLGVLLHPLGILGLLGIQWWARLRHSLGFSSAWKGRVYHDG